MNCNRCGTKTNTSMMSFFNQDLLCMKCIKIEKKHPLYRIAVDIERAHVKNNNYNYEGIGLPESLRLYYKRNKK